MADQPTVEDKKPVTAANEVEPATMPTPAVVNDSNLLINVSTPTAQASTPVTPSPVVTAPESPILVTELEVLPNQLNSPGLAEEVESLSGEIQALEAKIDRLTGNIQPVVDAPKVSTQDSLPVNTQATPPPVVTTKPTTEEVASKPVSEPKPAPVLAEPTPKKSESKTASINDIYSKVADQSKTPVAPSSDEAEDVTSGSSIGTIGEVLAVFGVTIFMVMSAFPFYKTLLSENITDAVRSIGWPTAVICLALGFLLGLFSQGKVATKIFTVIILLFAVLLYLGVAGFQNYLGPLGPMLESVFTFYR